jgi:hypothetical protein
MEEIFAFREKDGTIERDEDGRPKTLKSTINLEEYIKMMLPPENFSVSKRMIEEESVQYVQEL